MKPLNLNTGGCDPVSSNCVIWQGPDIPCIKLCKGDTVSDVVFKLATELCTVLEVLDVSTYDLPPNCFVNPTCNPNDFKDLIQLIIYKICCLQNNVSVTSDPNSACVNGGLSISSSGGSGSGGGAGSRVSGSSSGCPDCEVPIASCFQYVNEFGDTVSTMQLVDYERAIGNKICELVNQILIINTAISELDVRVTALENTPPPTVVLPKVVPTCVITPAIPLDMNIVLSSLEQQFCQLSSVIGTPTTISNAIAKECVDLSNSYRLTVPTSTMSTIPGWVFSSATLANSLNNMWLSICDIRTAVRTIQLNCCPSGCDGIAITLNASLNVSLLKIWFSGTLPSGFDECDPAGNTYTISDSLGNSVNIQIDTVNYLNDASGYSYDLSLTPINLSSNITIESDLCFKNASTNTTCQFCVSYVIMNQSICPELDISADEGDNFVIVSFTPLTYPANYTIEIWNSTYTAIVTTQTVNITTGGLKSYAMGPLSYAAVYHARLVISSGGKNTSCGYVTFTSPNFICDPPTNLSPFVSVPVLCDTCGLALEFSDNPTVDGTYVDVSSDYLLQYSGGSFGNMIQLTSDQPIGGTVRQPISFAGRTWVVTNDTNIEVYSDADTGTPVLDTTITPGVNGIVNMVYDTNLDLVFFVYNDTVTGFRKIGTINPNTYAVTLNVGPAFSGGANQAQELYFNPVTFEKYVRVGDGDIYVLSAGATSLTLQATLTAVGAAALRYVIFDPVSGNAWIATSDSTNTEEILVVNGSTYAIITTLNTAVAGMQPYVGNVNTNAMAFYSDGTSSTVYVIYRSTVANYNYMIIAYNASTYIETTFLNEGVADVTPQPRQIFYSNVFGKVVYTRATIVDMFAPSSSSTDYTPTITLANSVLRIHEDVVNSLLVFSTNVASPSNNLFWYEVDPSNAVKCTEGIVTLYIGNQGPFEFNSVSSSWDALCSSTITPSTPGPGYFTVSANLSGSVLSAALIYSNDFGLTWNSLNDTSGNLYANGAAWLLGRVYPNQTPTTYYKVIFVTDTNCGLQGPLMT